MKSLLNLNQKFIFTLVLSGLLQAGCGNNYAKTQIDAEVTQESRNLEQEVADTDIKKNDNSDTGDDTEQKAEQKDDSETSSASVSKGVENSHTPSTTKNFYPDNTDEEKTVAEDKEITTRVFGLVGRKRFKAFEVLKTSIQTCFGDPDITQVKAGMLLPDNQNAAAPMADVYGRIPFLLPNQFTAGEDILEREAQSLGGDLSGCRNGSCPDVLSAQYLNSISLVGEVVAYNCELNESVNCSCSTANDAEVLLRRCLPSLDPSEEAFKQMTIQLSQQCSLANKQEARKAIWAIVSSYPFILQN